MKTSPQKDPDHDVRIMLTNARSVLEYLLDHNKLTPDVREWLEGRITEYNKVLYPPDGVMYKTNAN